jgi:hypothetical protein
MVKCSVYNTGKEVQDSDHKKCVKRKVAPQPKHNT